MQTSTLIYQTDTTIEVMTAGKLTCPAEGCGYNLRSEDSIHIFQYLGLILDYLSMRPAALLTRRPAQ